MSGVIGAGPFGNVPNTLVDTVTMEGLETLFTQIINNSKMANTHEQWQKLHEQEDYLQKLDAFRTGVGALYLNILRQIDKDLSKAHRVSNSFGNVWPHHCSQERSDRRNTILFVDHH